MAEIYHTEQSYIRLKVPMEEEQPEWAKNNTNLSSLFEQRTSGLRVVSNYTPSKKSPCIETFVSFVKKYIHSSLYTRTRTPSPHYNLSRPEFRAIEKLRECKDIVINPADKAQSVTESTGL